MKSKTISLADAARIIHNCVNSLNEVLDFPQTQLDEETLESTISAIKFHLANDLTPEESHDLWMKTKLELGWKYGEVKDVEKKTHPDLVPYEDLPIQEKLKDEIFISLVKALKPIIELKE